MSIQRVCDKCGKEFEEGEVIYVVTTQKQSSLEGPVTDDGSATQTDFHENHLPKGLHPDNPSEAPEPQ